MATICPFVADAGEFKVGPNAGEKLRRRKRLGKIVNDVLDVETGARGFALTGEEAFLQPFASGKKEVVRNLEELRKVTADNPEQQKHLDSWETQIREVIRVAQQIAGARDQRSAVSLATLRENKKSMDAVRATAKAMDEYST